MNPPPPYFTQADLGATAQPGTLVPEAEEERFHAPWERHAFALTLAMGATGAWNLDQSRDMSETLPHYRDLSYYAIWLEALERLLLERGLVTEAELRTRRAQTPPVTLPRRLAAADVPAVLRRGAPTARPASQVPRYAPGDTVRTRADGVPHHTRLPAYARGRRGTIVQLHGAHVFADAHAQGQGEQACALYTVRFDAAELFGEATSARSVTLDLWEPYLEPCDQPAPRAPGDAEPAAATARPGTADSRPPGPTA